jgi:hypothetical protein
MELWPAIMAPRAFQFLETTPRCHELSKLRQAGTTNRLNGGWAGCHDRFSPPRPVGGEMFLLTAPFMERPSDGLAGFRKSVCKQLAIQTVLFEVQIRCSLILSVQS